MGHHRLTRQAGGLRDRALVSLLAFLCAIALAGAWGAARADASNFYKVAVYSTIGTSQQGLTGHVYVQLRHDSTNEIYGKYPEGWWVFDTTAKLENDGDKPWSWRITYGISEHQWRRVTMYLAEQRKQPGRYKLLSDNCVEFAAQVLKQTGLSLPHYRNLVGVPEPTALTSSLEKIGSGHTFEAGDVLKNPHPSVTSSGAPDPPSPTPPCCDADKILASAASDPRKLASALRLEFRRFPIAPDSVAPNGTYRVTITHTGVRQNLYAVTWGDGSRTLGERPRTSAPGTVSFRHHYTSSPTHPLTVVIVQNGRVLEYVRSLRRHGSGAHAEIDAEPAPPPARLF